MTAPNLVNIKNKMKKNGILMSFTGSFTQGVIQEIGETLKAVLMEDGYISPVGFDVFSVFIEQTQNIINYINKNQDASDVNSDFINSGIVSIKKIKDEYRVCAANLVHNHDVKSISERLDFIISKSPEEITKLFMEQLKKKRVEGVNNAGLGFLEIAQRVTQPLLYEFIERDEKYSNFIIIATI